MTKGRGVISKAMRHHVWDQGRSWSFVVGLLAAGVAHDIHATGESFALRCCLSAAVVIPLWMLAALRDKTRIERITEYSTDPLEPSQ